MSYVIVHSIVIADCCHVNISFFFFKQKTAYEMRISDWSSDVCALPIYGSISLAELARTGHDDEASRIICSVVLQPRDIRVLHGDIHHFNIINPCHFPKGGGMKIRGRPPVWGIHKQIDIQNKMFYKILCAACKTTCGARCPAKTSLLNYYRNRVLDSSGVFVQPYTSPLQKKGKHHDSPEHHFYHYADRHWFGDIGIRLCHLPGR